jgi:hypothetical protein
MLNRIWGDRSGSSYLHAKGDWTKKKIAKCRLSFSRFQSKRVVRIKAGKTGGVLHGSQRWFWHAN